MTLVIAAIVAFLVYSYLKSNKQVNSTWEDATKSVTVFKDSMEESLQAAKASYEAAQYERRVDELADDPELLADVLEARKAKKDTTHAVEN